MNTNIELALLTKVVDSKDFHTLTRAKIDESFFSSHEAASVYRYINETYNHPNTSGEVPSRELIQMYFPTFPFFASNDGISVLCEQLKRSKLSMEIQLFAQDLVSKVELNPMEALATLRSDAPRISALADTSEDYSMAAAATQLKARYELIQSSQGLLGIPYPWVPLNEATQGMQNGQFIVIYGRPKSMKTWVGLYMAIHAYVSSRRRVLFYSREMPPMTLLQRAACILARIDYGAFTAGRLQPELKQRFYTILDELVDDERMMGTQGIRQPYFVVVSDRGAPNGGGVSWLRSKIEEYDPDICFVDGMYLMSDDRTKSRTIDWKNITHISQDMKLTGTHFDIPIVGITQANRGAEKTNGEDLTELAFADALGQDADAIFRVKKPPTRIDEATKRKIQELYVTAPGLREGVFEGIVIHGHPGYDFELVKTLTSTDQIPADGGGYKESKGGAPPPGPGDRRLRQRSPFHSNGTLRDPKLPYVK